MFGLVPNWCWTRFFQNVFLFLLYLKFWFEDVRTIAQGGATGSSYQFRTSGFRNVEKERGNQASFTIKVWIMSFGRVMEYWNWRWILKCLFTFCFFYVGSKNSSASFLMKSPDLFYVLKEPQNTFLRNNKKIHNNFNIHRPVQMTWSIHK